ncbi:SURF1 family protein [Rhodobacteraceae bacterium HSP-20]|uniref:SURF1-like protein n=1 Tax=Paragemmobacter amnigenus TaxID=2852097 RepID=A0ABS6J4M2_9RHOB|nr:SURF1 family protein [Rhodobacter amnigenus]MBU9698706.1 SURF1 family protein [Rhodobacter amnigenus]MBV4389933.1 SURF1 family protein [Rhodobacter amnigenus]
MTRRMIFPLLVGLLGGAILISLGVWQMQRLAWKEGVLAEIAARIADAPVALPATVDPVADRYMPVTATGRFTGEHADILVSRKQIGAGVRVVEVFETADGRRVLVDRGFLTDDDRAKPRESGPATVEGNLHWPEETDGFTPPPDPKTGLWFARDVAALSAALETEATFIVARKPTGGAIEPMPVDTSGIPNDHMNYAITWFSLAAVWLGMTAYLLWRIRQRTV